MMEKIVKNRRSNMKAHNLPTLRRSPQVVKHRHGRVFFLLVITISSILLLLYAMKGPSMDIKLEIHPYPSRLPEEKERVAALAKIVLDKVETEYTGTTDVSGPLDAILQWSQSIDGNTKGWNGKTQMDVLPLSLSSEFYPQFMAVRWLALDDTYISADANADADAVAAAAGAYSTLLQRYALSVLYFASSGDTWDRCSRISSSPCEGEDMAVEGAGGRRFLGNSSECEWEGITCSRKDGTIWIELTSNNLSSQPGNSIIPMELVLLKKKIQLLWLSSNLHLHGTIPDYVGEFSELATLSLFDTSLSGTIPDSLLKLKKLTALRLHNTSLEGTISSHMGNMKKLSWLWLHGSHLTGLIPSELGKLRELNALTLHGNDFDALGEFPQEICSLKKKKNLLHLWTDCTDIEANREGTVKEDGGDSEEMKHTCHCCTRCLVRDDHVGSSE
mmetsp:Transcript_10894/g.16104  ORF Transcript_10894/g.16104 Transcript_10894/m.16104 type:complete len:445 (+) Transcript_10894:148-1482(+)